MPHGHYSICITLPSQINKGRETTLAAGSKLIILDPTAEVSEDWLLEFLLEFVEPAFWPWYQKKKAEEANKK